MQVAFPFGKYWRYTPPQCVQRGTTGGYAGGAAAGARTSCPHMGQKFVPAATGERHRGHAVPAIAAGGDRGRIRVPGLIYRREKDLNPRSRCRGMAYPGYGPGPAPAPMPMPMQPMPPAGVSILAILYFIQGIAWIAGGF